MARMRESLTNVCFVDGCGHPPSTTAIWVFDTANRATGEEVTLRTVVRVCHAHLHHARDLKNGLMEALRHPQPMWSRDEHGPSVGSKP